MAIKPTTPITNGQARIYFVLVENAAKQAFQESNATGEIIRNLIKNGDKFQDRIVATIKDFLSDCSSVEEV